MSTPPSSPPRNARVLDEVVDIEPVIHDTTKEQVVVEEEVAVLPEVKEVKEQPPKPKPHTDEYGFITTHTTPSSPPHPHPQTKPLESTWTTLLATWESSRTKHHTKIKSLCRKGIPQSLRGRVWCSLSGSSIYAKSFPDDYYTSLLTKPPLPIYEIIDRDIHRCYPTHSLFTEPNGQGQEWLRIVLRAYAQHNPSLGYCQGMGFIAGLLLMYIPPEEAFWVLVVLVDKYFMDYYEENMSQIRIDAGVFSKLIPKVVSKKLSKHLDRNDVEPIMYITQWFLTGYTMLLPWEVVLRVWDVLFLEGPKILFRVGLGVLSVCESRLLKSCPGTAELMEFLLHVPKDLEVFDNRGDGFMKQVFKLSLSRKQIKELDDMFRKKLPKIGVSK